MRRTISYSFVWYDAISDNNFYNFSLCDTNYRASTEKAFLYSVFFIPVVLKEKMVTYWLNHSETNKWRMFKYS